MMCFMMMSAQAQIYGYDDYVRMPTMDLYDPGIMNMAIRAQAEAAARQQEMAARRQEMFRFLLLGHWKPIRLSVGMM